MSISLSAYLYDTFFQTVHIFKTSDTCPAAFKHSHIYTEFTQTCHLAGTAYIGGISMAFSSEFAEGRCICGRVQQIRILLASYASVLAIEAACASISFTESFY